MLYLAGNRIFDVLSTGFARLTSTTVAHSGSPQGGGAPLMLHRYNRNSKRQAAAHEEAQHLKTALV